MFVVKSRFQLAGLPLRDYLAVSNLADPCDAAPSTWTLPRADPGRAAQSPLLNGGWRQGGGPSEAASSGAQAK